MSIESSYKIGPSDFFSKLPIFVLKNFLPFLDESERAVLASCNKIFQFTQIEWSKNESDKRFQRWEVLLKSIKKTVPIQLATEDNIEGLKISPNSISFTTRSFGNLKREVLDIRSLSSSCLLQVNNSHVHFGSADGEVSVYKNNLTGKCIFIDNTKGSILHETDFSLDIIRVFGTEKANQVLEIVTSTASLFLFDLKKIAKNKESYDHPELNATCLYPRAVQTEYYKTGFQTNHSLNYIYKVGRSYYCQWSRGHEKIEVITFIRDINFPKEQRQLDEKSPISCESDNYFFYVFTQNRITMYKAGRFWKTFKVGDITTSMVSLFPTDFGLVVQNLSNPGITIWNHRKYEPKNTNIRPLIEIESSSIAHVFVERDLLIYDTEIWNVYHMATNKEIRCNLPKESILEVATICNPMPQIFVVYTFSCLSLRQKLKLSYKFHVFSLDNYEK